MWLSSGTKKYKEMAYITEYLVGLAGTDGVLLFWMAGPLVQVGAIQDVAQHVLTALSYLVSDDVGWDVVFSLRLMVVLLVDPLLMVDTWKSKKKNKKKTEI